MGGIGGGSATTLPPCPPPLRNRASPSSTRWPPNGGRSAGPLPPSGPSAPSPGGSGPVPAHPRDDGRSPALSHALRPRRAHAECLGPDGARGGGPPDPGHAPRGRRRPVHQPDARPGSAPGIGHRGREAALGPGRRLAGRGGVLRGASRPRPGSCSRSGRDRIAPTRSSISSPPFVAACGASSFGRRTSTVAPSRSVPTWPIRRHGPSGPKPTSKSWRASSSISMRRGCGPTRSRCSTPTTSWAIRWPSSPP